jgi:SAM-dependent MidA family methyltransferase
VLGEQSSRAGSPARDLSFVRRVTSLERLIAERIDESGPLTVAEYMELALYHPSLGYYATHAQRSGRNGDFYTSVDVGPLFGACLAQYLACRYRQSRGHQIPTSPRRFDLVDAGAGNGRLARDILDAAVLEFPDFYEAIELHLVERSPAARAAQRDVLGPHAARVVSSGSALPHQIYGAVIANELLDALPCHLVTMASGGLREIYVGPGFKPIAGRLSSPAIEAQLSRVSARLEPGWRAEVNLNASQWITEAARALRSGELLVFDYGYEAVELYSAARASGTLARYTGHQVDDRWLENPGEGDLTSHVDFTAARLWAEAGGLQITRFVDQTRFLLDAGLIERLATGSGVNDVRQRLQGRTLIAPAGLGSTIKLIAFQRPAGG